jgi:hypothetical protein
MVLGKSNFSFVDVKRRLVGNDSMYRFHVISLYPRVTSCLSSSFPLHGLGFRLVPTSYSLHPFLGVQHLILFVDYVRTVLL